MNFPTTPLPKPRARALGLPLTGTAGRHNAITDVPGVEVGFATRLDPEGPARTGVTTIFPCGRAGADRSVWAGHFALNGNGVMTGLHWVDDAGYFTGPVALTNSHAVGLCQQAMTRWMISAVPRMRTHHHWYMPVVAETYDGLCNDINGLHLAEDDVLAALAGARGGPLPEGNVGGGTGMQCYEFKGGTGTSSRVVSTEAGDFTVGVLVQANFGMREELQVLGVPVGRLWPQDAPLTALGQGETGSVIVVLACDAPLSPAQLRRLAKRCALGIARTGTTGGVNSGDLMLAFTTAAPRAWTSAELFHGEPCKQIPTLEDNLTDGLHQAAAHATEEAVLNALLAARDMSWLRPPGPGFKAIDADRLLRTMRDWRALA